MPFDAVTLKAMIDEAMDELRSIMKQADYDIDGQKVDVTTKKKELRDHIDWLQGELTKIDGGYSEVFEAWDVCDG